MNIKRRPITAAQDNNYKDNGGYAEYTSETKDLYNSIVALYEKSCKVLSESAGPSVKLGEALEAMYDLFPRYGLDEDIEASTKITAGRRDSGIAVNTAREVYSELCDTYFKATVGVNAPFSPDGAPMQHLTKAIEAIDDIYAFGLSDEDREAMSEDIEGACGKKSVKGADGDDTYSVVLEEEYGPYTGSRVLHKGLDKASAKSAQRHYSKNAPMNQSYYTVDDEELERRSKRPIRSSDDFDDEDEYVEPENEGAVSLAYDGEYMRSFGASLLQELIEARLSGPVNVYSVEIGNNLTTVYFEIEDMDDYSIEEAEYDIERAVDDIVNYGEEAEDGRSLDDAMYMDMGYNQYS